MAAIMISTKKEQLELSLLLQAIEQHYGYDFHDYATASLARRIKKYITTHHISHISDLIPLLLHNQLIFSQFIKQLSVPVTEGFRDPSFFKAISLEVIPLLRTYPFIKIWHAGCATGQEVYSMAILLEEAGLLDRCLIYATDFNEGALDIAKQGIYTQSELELFEKNYHAVGGRGKFSQYYTVCDHKIKFNNLFVKNITFANHNLVTDGVFGEMNIIFCRNVCIYFNQSLQDRVLTVIKNSLCPLGILCIGKRENIRFSAVSNNFAFFNKKQRIYQKKNI